MEEYKQQLYAILERAYKEGVDDTLASINATHDGDGTPLHNIESIPTRVFFDALDPDGYKDSDYSRLWPVLLSTDVDSGRAEMNFPYCVYGKGDKVIVECDDEPAQTILPYKEVFAIFNMTPGHTYRWTMMSGMKVIKSGTFKATGRVRWMKTRENKYPHNLRDIGFPASLAAEGGGMRFGRIYRGEHPDKIEVDSIDHEYLRDQLGITVQLNLRDADDDPARSDLFEQTYSYNIPAYDTLLTASAEKKKRFRDAFHAIVTELKAGRNVLVNCWQGRDRTGTFCWFLQALCMMLAGYLQGHWELSSLDRCENSMIWEEVHSESKLREMTAKFKAKWGDDPYKQALGLAKLVGIDEQDIIDFQSIMLCA